MVSEVLKIRKRPGICKTIYLSWVILIRASDVHLGGNRTSHEAVAKDARMWK